MARWGLSSDGVTEFKFREATFDGFVFFLLSGDDVEDRKVVSHKYPNRSGALARDRGGDQRITACEIIFFETPDMPDPLASFESFRKLIKTGKVGRFVHPLTEPYDAKPRGFRWRWAATPVNSIMVRLTFVEATLRDNEDLVVQRIDRAAGLGIQAGVEATRQAEISIDAELLSLGLTSDLSGTFTAKTEDWAEAGDDISAREITLQLNKLTSDINSEIDRLQLTSDINRQPLLQSYQELHSAVRRAAETAISRSRRLTEVTVASPAPLLAIAAQLYPNENAPQRADEILELNDLENPAMVAQGTVLTVRAE